MNSTLRYILIGIGIIAAAIILWYFIHIVAYILLSAVLALMGRPIVDLLGKIRIRKLIIPKSIRALIAILIIWGFVFVFFRIFVPIIASEVEKLSSLNPDQLLAALNEPLNRLDTVLEKYRIRGQHITAETFIAEKVKTYLNIDKLSGLFGSFASILGNLFIAFFSVSFITYFFLRDESLFAEGVLIMVPDNNVVAFRHAMTSTRKLLMRYFIGLLAQITGIFVMVTIGVLILGLEFRQSLLIALVAAVFQIIPYLGPLIGSAIGIILAVAYHIEMDFATQILPLIKWMILIYIVVHLIDNFICQPLIFSKSVSAHPVEIFILLLIAGSLAGIPGMIIAIPAYTVLRVFAKEFFNKFKVVKKLTKNIT